MTVDDLFQLNKDYGQIQYLVGEDGGERQILDIDILELPDGMYWVSEGDFIITMGYFFNTSDVKFENFVRMLIRNRAAGLGVKLGRFFDQIPDNALKLAQKHHFPIINYPLHMSYKSMTRPVLNYLLGEESYSSYTLKEYKRQLNELVREKYDIAVIMEHLKRYINHELFLLWENISGFIYKTTEEGSREIKRVLEENRFNLAYSGREKPYRYGERGFRIYRTGGKEQILAFLCIMEREERSLSATDEEIILETLPYLLIYLYSETRLGQYVTRSKENFFIDVIDGKYEKREEALVKDAEELGIRESRLRCLVGVPVSGLPAEAVDRMYRKISLYLDSYKFLYTLFSASGCIFVILAPKNQYDSVKLLDRYWQDLAGDLRGSLKEERLILCVSGFHHHLREIAEAYEEVRSLIKLPARDERKVYYYEDFMMAHLMSDIQNQFAVNHIYETVITKIEDYDKKNKSAMKETLAALAETDFNLTKAAEKMYLHRNTLYKRVEKIETLLGFNLENGDVRLMLQLVMKLERWKTGNKNE